SFCTDGEICRVGFMTTADAAAYVKQLAGLGFRSPTQQDSPDVAVISQMSGFDYPCDWLELGRIELDDGQFVQVAWALGTELSDIVAPPNWKPGTMRHIPMTDLSEHEFLGTEESVDVFRNKATGELLYVGRTQDGAPPAHISLRSVEDRLKSLADELSRL